MPACKKDGCNNVQSKLNRGGLCKSCFKHKIDLYNNPVKPQRYSESSSVDTDSDDGDVNPILNDNNIKEFIKQHMMREKLWHEEKIKILTDEIIYLKEEHFAKNKIIESLMTQLGNCHQEDRNDDSMAESNSADQNDIIHDNTSLNREPSFVGEVNLHYPNGYMDSQPIENEVNVATSNRFISLSIDNNDGLPPDDINASQNISHNNINNKIQSAERRPDNVINRNPERDEFAYRPTRPGNSSYAKITGSGKKIALITDSLCSRIKMKNFNRFINSGRAYRKAFPGGTSDEIAYYCMHTLSTNNPDTVIINAGSNDLQNMECDAIAENIFRIVDQCQLYGVNNVYVSSMIYREGLMHKVTEVNNILKGNELSNNYVLIDNSNVTSYHIWSDKIHPNNEGLTVLANNFINALNKPCTT